MEAIKKIEVNDGSYPLPLKEIKKRPESLYVRGEILPKENCFAIVGARQCSDYGKKIAMEIAGDLADAGLVIVSGLAPGIDSFVHRTVVERKKRTIAVLGTGLDEQTIYPRENLGLAKNILETGGCLLSEYPPLTRGTQFSFPQRNRIISGLSFGVLVIEAKEKSGALITAEWARKQQRKIFAVPGPVYSLNSKGCHFLIKKGATLVESAEDVLRELKLSLKTFERKEVAGDTEEENSILNGLKEEPLYIDKIIKKSNLPAAKVAGLLAILEIKGKVRNLGGNVYTIS